MPEEFMIECYDATSGWSTVPSPVTDINHDALNEVGFSSYLKAGADFAFEIEVYRDKDDRYLVFASGIDGSITTILARSFPSLVELMAKLSPMCLAGQSQLMYELIDELQQLSTADYGPLEKARIAREQRLAAERKQSRREIDA